VSGGVKTVLVYTAPVNRSFDWDGHYIFEHDRQDPTALGNPCGFSGLVSALRGDYRSIDRADPASLAPYDIILVVPKLDFALPWLREVRRRFPDKLLVGQYEENVRKHKVWCRSWSFQRDFYEFAQTVDMLTTFTDATRGYYELFSARPVAYLPHPYPVEWLASRSLWFGREAKAQLLLKAGYVHGRIGTDGFAELAVLQRLAQRRPGFAIGVEQYPGTTDEVVTEADIRERQHRRRLHEVLYDGRAVRWLPSQVRRAVRRLLFEPAPAGRPEDPLLMRGFDAGRVEVTPRQPWHRMLEVWGRARVALDMDWCWTVGRNAADAAATGTPLVGCNSDFQLALFPGLVVEELDYEGAERLVTRLLQDDGFYDEVAAHARRALEAFSYAATERRFQALLEPVMTARRSDPA
jgi:glycosyltransferase involved in cell wall biosynthesis